ncbi:MAG: hypothetical protein ABGX42_04320 [Gammaproteobacteria bacterium]
MSKEGSLRRIELYKKTNSNLLEAEEEFFKKHYAEEVKTIKKVVKKE